jgi:hypothetical protein
VRKKLRQRFAQITRIRDFNFHGFCPFLKIRREINVQRDADNSFVIFRACSGSSCIVRVFGFLCLFLFPRVKFPKPLFFCRNRFNNGRRIVIAQTVNPVL